MSKKFGRYYDRRLKRFREKIYTELLKREGSLTKIGHEIGVTPQRVYSILNGYVKSWELHKQAIERAVKTL